MEGTSMSFFLDPCRISPVMLLERPSQGNYQQTQGHRTLFAGPVLCTFPLFHSAPDSQSSLVKKAENRLSR